MCVASMFEVDSGEWNAYERTFVFPTWTSALSSPAIIDLPLVTWTVFITDDIIQKERFVLMEKVVRRFRVNITVATLLPSNFRNIRNVCHASERIEWCSRRRYVLDCMSLCGVCVWTGLCCALIPRSKRATPILLNVSSHVVCEFLIRLSYPTFCLITDPESTEFDEVFSFSTVMAHARSLVVGSFTLESKSTATIFTSQVATSK